MKIPLSLFFVPLLCWSLSAQVSCDCGENLELDAGSGFTTYSWSDGSTNQVVNIDPLCPSDAGTYTVTVTDECGTASDTYNVSVCSSGTVGINTVFYTGSSQLCLLLASAPTCCKNPQYQWTNPCGEIVSNDNILASENGRNDITVCGTYTLTLVSCNGCTECTSTATINIQNGGSNSPDCCGGSCGCVGCTAQITSWYNTIQCNQQGTYTATSCTGATLTWEVLNGSTVVATGSGSTFNWTPSNNGTYTVRLTVLDDCGITTTDAVTTTVNGCTASCEDCSNIEIVASNTPSCNTSSTFSINCASATNITWSVTGGGGNPNGTQFTYTPTANGTYSVSVQFTDECGNIITDTFTFSISNCVTCQDCTASNITASNTPSCDDPTTFGIVCPNTSSYTWTVNGTTQASTSSTMTYTPTSNQNYNVEVSFVDECGNSISKSYNFTITDCTLPCDCTVSAVADDANCEIDITVTGANCNNYTMTVLKYGSDDGSCTMGNCTLYNNLSATSQTVAGGDCTGNSNDLADYKIVLFPNSGTGCTIKEGCVTLDCCSDVINQIQVDANFCGDSALNIVPVSTTINLSTSIYSIIDCGLSGDPFTICGPSYLTNVTADNNATVTYSSFSNSWTVDIDDVTNNTTTIVTIESGCDTKTLTLIHDCP